MVLKNLFFLLFIAEKITKEVVVDEVKHVVETVTAGKFRRDSQVKCCIALNASCTKVKLAIGDEIRARL